ncbi:hypothetical protein, partial [Shewanella sp.]|uniref:hypothetical protein n=1 Tax=Shewanella sp. TaxID=50422 RepID=UPI0040473463
NPGVQPVIPVTLLSRNPAVVFTFQARSKETPGSLIQALRDDGIEQHLKLIKLTTLSSWQRPLLRHSGNAFKAGIQVFSPSFR